MSRGDESLEKTQRLRAWMERTGLDGVLLATPSNFAWLTAGANNYVSIAAPRGVAWLLIVPEAAFLLANNIELPRMIDEELHPQVFEPMSWEWHESDQPARTLRTLAAGRRVAADTPVPGLSELPDGFAELRYTLSEPEVERYRAVGRDAAEAVERTCFQLERGSSELEISGVLARQCRQRDVLPLVNLVAADERISRYRHPLPTQKRLDRMVMVVLTGWRAGLHASLTRLVSFEPIPPELQQKHDAVTAVDAWMILESRPGATLGAALRAGIDQYNARGFRNEWRKHHQGGLTGYAGREIFATPETNHRLESDQAVAWNPSITGTKSEDTVLVGPDEPHVLTRTGEWPETERTAAGASLYRPDILVRRSG